MLVDDLAAGQALQIGRPGVVGVDRLDHARTRDARDVPEQHHHEREARQQEVLHLLGGVRTRRGGGADREPLEPEAEDEDEDDRGHELRDRGQREARDGDQAVRHPPPPQAGDRAAEDAERDDEHEGDGGELERVDERRPEQIRDRDLVLQRRAEVAVEEVREPVPVLLVERTVEPERLVEVVDVLLAREGAEHVAPDVSRQHLRRREDDDAEQEERDQRVGEPLEQEPGDGVFLRGLKAGPPRGDGPARSAQTRPVTCGSGRPGRARRPGIPSPTSSRRRCSCRSTGR